jgi:hypothetical protein
VTLLPFALAVGLMANTNEPWAPTTSGPMTSLTAPLTPPQRLTLQPIALFVTGRGALDDDGVLVASPVDAHVAGQLFVEAGLLDWLTFGMQPHAIARANGDAGAADTLLFARVAWHDIDRPPHPAATWIFQATLPTGDATRDFGSGALVATSGTSFSLYREPFVFHADALFSVAYPDDAGRRVRPTAQWTLAMEAPVPFVSGALALVLELGGKHQGTPLDAALAPNAGPPEHELVLGAGVEVIASDEVQALVGWQRTLWGRNVDALDTIVVTVVPLL